MRIGIVGAGNIGTALARAWVAAGHEVLLSFSRDQGRLRRLAQELGPSATVGGPADASRSGRPWC